MAEKNYLEIFEMDHFRRIFAQKFDFPLYWDENDEKVKLAKIFTL